MWDSMAGQRKRVREMWNVKEGWQVKCVISYVRNYGWWMFSVLFCGIVMSVFMLMNGVAVNEILYGMLLCAVLALGVSAVGFYRYKRKYLSIIELGYSASAATQIQREPRDVLEEAYLNIVKEISDQKCELENGAIRRERDLMEYYTMWVHQIKTPIAALKLLIQEDGDWDTEGEDEANRRQLYREEHRSEELQELFRIEQYVEMALQYMRFSSETTDFVLRRIDLDVVIRETVHKYARQFVSKKISLRYDALNKSVVSDEKWLEFVIEQLLSNAIKYTQKGSITIEAGGSEESGGPKEDFRIIITDTGIGIRAEDLPRICEKGYTGYNGHADKQSTGIGLYLCSRILQKLGHGFSISSEEGKGTVATITFYENEE